jgi:signal transduction histidine kinase
LTKTIKTVIENIKQQAETKNQTLQLSLATDIPIVMADEFSIGQVLLNLVANAVNYVPEKGQITIKAERKEGLFQISVKDNGHGIPKEALSKLFTKFFRVSGALEQGSKGTGLGLFISKSIIEMHGGKIWVESEIEKGATFTFVLPIATPKQIREYQEKKEQANLTVKSGQGIIIRNRR